MEDHDFNTVILQVEALSTWSSQNLKDRNWELHL